MAAIIVYAVHGANHLDEARLRSLLSLLSVQEPMQSFTDQELVGGWEGRPAEACGESLADSPLHRELFCICSKRAVATLRTT